MLGARAAKREPAAARKLIERAAPPPAAPPGFIGGIPGPSSFIGSLEIVLAEVTTEPDLRRALVLAQQAPGPVLQASALRAVRRRPCGCGSQAIAAGTARPFWRARGPRRGRSRSLMTRRPPSGRAAPAARPGGSPKSPSSGFPCSRSRESRRPERPFGG